MITTKDLSRLRDLAKQQMELATSEEMNLLRKEWVRHGAFQKGRPMVLIETCTFANDILLQRLTCEEEEARALEYMFMMNTINHLEFKDDFIVKPYLPVGMHYSFKPWNIDVELERSENSGGFGQHIVSQVSDLEKEFHKFQKSTYQIDKQAPIDRMNYLNELFGDIIPAKRTGGGLNASLTNNLVHVMQMEHMFLAMYDAPELLKKVLDMLADDYVALFKDIEREGLLLSTTEDEWLCQGSLCFTDELPHNLEHYTTKDVWGYTDSQETVGVSAAMFEEFYFPSIKKVSETYGLLSYGCCEAVDPFWERCISTLQNLKKVSISAWCNEAYMGEQLRGKKIVYLRKPTPNLIGVGTTLDEEAVHLHIKKTMEAAKGCTIEFSQRDVYQVNHDVGKVARFVEIIKEESN